MNESPLVSVLIATYNREKYIGAAIQSILASTYTNFELLIVDDGSSDKTLEIARSFADKDSRVQVYRNEKNLGDYPNRNKVAEYAKGKYLKYVDDDDFIYPWGLQILVDCMEANPSAGWGLCSLFPDIEKPYPILLNSQQAYRYHYLGPGLFHKAPLSSIIKRELFFSVGGFQKVRFSGDYLMWHKLAKVSPVLLMPDGVVWNRMHAGQESRFIRNSSMVYENITWNELTAPDCPLDEADVRKFVTIKRRKAFKFFIGDLLRLRWRSVFDNMSVLRFYLSK